MGLKTFTLIEKNKINRNIFEMIFQSDEISSFTHGQFVTFILPKIGGRAYSILNINGDTITLIIKKRESEDGGRGGSKFICEREVGDVLNGVGPAGHFVLQNNHKNKLFLGTGTGLVPLYNQVLGSLENKQESRLKVIFGVRSENDLFYVDKLEQLKNKNSNFDYKVYISSEDVVGCNRGYITDFLTKENIESFDEFYICGIPKMIDSSIEILEKNGVQKENIFTEKY